MNIKNSKKEDDSKSFGPSAFFDKLSNKISMYAE